MTRHVIQGCHCYSLTSNAPRQLNIALHDRYTFGVYSTEVPKWSRNSVTKRACLNAEIRTRPRTNGPDMPPLLPARREELKSANEEESLLHIYRSLSSSPKRFPGPRARATGEPKGGPTRFWMRTTRVNGNLAKRRSVLF